MDRGAWQATVHGVTNSANSASICLLVGACNLFTFKVIIDMHIPISILLITCLVLFCFGMCVEGGGWSFSSLLSPA